MQEIKKCRSCGSTSLEKVLDLGEQFLTCFPTDGNLLKIPRGQLKLVSCKNCTLVQLAQTFPPELLYSWYGYRSGINPMMVDALSDVASSAVKYAFWEENDVVVDIGANDGTLLGLFGGSFHRVGFDPAKNLAKECRKNCEVFINDFFSANKYLSQAVGFPERPGCKASIVTAIAMFYDLDDPRAFCKEVAAILKKDGLFVVQMNYLPSMLEKGAFDNISHEHVCYYSLCSLMPVLESAGLRIIDAEVNDVNGGSVRVYCSHIDGGMRINGGDDRLSQLLAAEARVLAGGYGVFAARAQRTCSVLESFVHTQKCAGRSVYVCGASTRGLVVMQAAHLDYKSISGASERNPEKWGRYFSGTLIPCVPEEEAREKAHVMLVLPWQFIDEILNRETEFLMRGGRMVVALPEPTLYYWEGGGIREVAI